MRIFKSIIPDGALKFFNKYLNVELSAEIFDAMQAAYEDFSSETEGFILKGGVAAGSSPSATIGDSIVVLNGKILRLAADTGLTYPFFIIEATPTEINGDFGDLTSQPVIDNEFAEVVASDPGGVQVITIPAAGTFQKGGFAKRIIEDNGAVLKSIVIDIGDWNMNTTAFVTVTHSLTQANIRVVNVMIRNDVGEAFLIHSPLDSISASDALKGGVATVLAGGILIRRTTGLAGEGFETTAYQDTSFNRGWITIIYEE